MIVEREMTSPDSLLCLTITGHSDGSQLHIPWIVLTVELLHKGGERRANMSFESLFLLYLPLKSLFSRTRINYLF